MEEVYLEEYSDEQFNQIMSDEIEYPSVLIENITTEEEFKFFKNKCVSGDSVLPLYCSVGGRVVRVGEFELSLDNLLAIRLIYNYSIYLLKDDGIRIPVNLDDPVQLIKFIRV